MTGTGPTVKRTVFSTPRSGEFLELRALQAQTGQPAEAFGHVVVKELLDNALDAAETAGRAPVIEIATPVSENVQSRFSVLDFSTRPTRKHGPGHLRHNESLYVDEIDYWTAPALPVRLVLTQGAGFCIEIGPYTFDSRDVAVLRSAIAGYDRATGTEKDQR